MYKQTDFKEPIKSFGCYFCVMLDIAERILGYPITKEDVMTIYNLTQKKVGYGGKPVAVGCYLNDPAQVSNLLLELKKSNKRIIQVGIKTDSGSNFWGGNKYDFEVFDKKTNIGSHFLTNNYNPDPRITPKEIKKTIYYRVVEMKK